MSDEGRGALVDQDDFAGREEPAARRQYVPGQYDELFLPEGEENHIILIRGKYRNKFFSNREQKLMESVDAYFNYMRHRIPPQYLNPLYAKEHRNWQGNATWGSLPCSAGPDPAHPSMCLPCRTPSQQLKAQPRYVWTVLHIAPYHEVPSARDETKTYLKKCVDGIRECQGCEKNLPIVGAARRYLNIGGMDHEVIKTRNQLLRRKCACGGTLTTVEYKCSRCGVSLMSLTQENKREFARIGDPKNPDQHKVYCPNCSIRVLGREVKECDQCGNPRMRDVFNSILTVLRKKSDKYLQLMITDTRPVGDFLEKYKAMTDPLDLAAIFSPRTISEQKEVIDASKAKVDDLSESR